MKYRIVSSNTDLAFLEGAFAKLEGALIGVEANACDSWRVKTMTRRPTKQKQQKEMFGY